MHLKSIKFLLFSYIGIALMGALLLTMPFAHHGKIKFLDAFFTSISAFTCTGLIVKDTALDFTPLGQGIILALIQLGGFGYMSMLGLLYVFFHKNLNNAERNMLKEALNYYSYEGLTGFIKKIFIYVVIIEGIGAVILSIDFSMRFGLAEGIWHGVFHSISAFNNAGFSTFSTNLTGFRKDFLINIVVCLLIIIGGLGYVSIAQLHFFTYQKFYSQKSSKNRLSLHLKIVLSGTLILILSGMIMLLILEWKNPHTFQNFTLYEKILGAFFTSVNYRTAGFATYDLSGLYDSSMFFSTLLMIVGGAPGGTAAGIKITTVAVLLAFCRSILTNSQPRLFHRAISEDVIRKAIVIFLIACIYVLGTNLILAIAEPEVRYLPIMFEVSSAFATTGVSTGNGGVLSLSANFNDFGKSMMMIVMISGKIGILAFSLALFGRSKPSRVELVEERIML
ncbi:potassium transporter TrkG [Helicobacter sp. 11S03491-1]|uniref:TrkH family potassium uptake protein n=1 Tax=Helicobacter sp. 11S03491-1 TaxID=1476196 RepID=UPI000BA50A49|nr:potassium transporter TrkG [Helicobacter sp. 11S03491-1]PAF41576.1 hypothetical protein BKH45_06655 [Helicobacter sp. 11S03491-1]